VLEADLEGDGDGDSVVIGLVDVAVFSGCDDVGEIPNEVDILGEVNVDLIAEFAREGEEIGRGVDHNVGCEGV
jgi:hypothetical protein